MDIAATIYFLLGLVLGLAWLAVAFFNTQLQKIKPKSILAKIGKLVTALLLLFPMVSAVYMLFAFELVNNQLVLNFAHFPTFKSSFFVSLGFSLVAFLLFIIAAIVKPSVTAMEQWEQYWRTKDDLEYRLLYVKHLQLQLKVKTLQQRHSVTVGQKIRAMELQSFINIYKRKLRELRSPYEQKLISLLGFVMFSYRESFAQAR